MTDTETVDLQIKVAVLTAQIAAMVDRILMLEEQINTMPGRMITMMFNDMERQPRE